MIWLRRVESRTQTWDNLCRLQKSFVDFTLSTDINECFASQLSPSLFMMLSFPLSQEPRYDWEIQGVRFEVWGWSFFNVSTWCICYFGISDRKWPHSKWISLSFWHLFRQIVRANWKWLQLCDWFKWWNNRKIETFLHSHLFTCPGLHERLFIRSIVKSLKRGTIFLIFNLPEIMRLTNLILFQTQNIKLISKIFHQKFITIIVVILWRQPRIINIWPVDEEEQLPAAAQAFKIS